MVRDSRVSIIQDFRLGGGGGDLVRGILGKNFFFEIWPHSRIHIMFSK